MVIDERKQAMETLFVRDLMSSEPVAVTPDDDLGTLRDLMIDRRIRHVPVVDEEGFLLGLVTHRDLLRASLIEQTRMPTYVQEAVLESIKVRDLMNEGLETVSPDTGIAEAADIMLDGKYGCLPVVEGEKLVGILTESDFVRYLAG